MNAAGQYSRTSVPPDITFRLPLADSTPIERELDLSTGASLTLELTLVPALERTQVEVKGEGNAVEQGSSPATAVSGQLAKEMPSRPATVADALPLVPGVVREPGGALRISDSPENRSALIVNSADVTDPATGQFGITVPMDSVQTVNVYQTAFLAEYGRFTAGLVSVETKRGGDKWKWELNDPFPEFRIRSWHLRGLKTATPRLNFEGPILPGKLYIAEGFEYEVRKTAVYTLPFPRNQKLVEGLNSFTQLDWVATNKQLLTATFHVVPQRLGHVNMDYFNPEETSPDAATHNYTGTLAHRMTLGQSMLESTFSVTSFDVAVWGRGEANLEVAPGGNSGNYFAQKQRSAVRQSGLSTFSFAPLNVLGTHHFKIGLYVASSEEDGRISENPVDILNAAGQLTRRISFPRDRQFEISDIEQNFFAQDHWIVSPRFSLDLGTRVESQEVSGAFRVAPRLGLAWNPIPGQGTTVRGGFGFFYDRVPLNVYVFNKYPDQVVTYYDAAGNVSGGPYLYLNTLGQAKVRHPFVFQQPIDGNFSPRSINWTHADRAAGRALPEAADRIHAKPVGRTGDPQPGSSRPGDQPGGAPAIGHRRIAVPPVRNLGAISGGGDARVDVLLHSQQGKGRPERFRDLSGDLSAGDRAAEPVRQFSGGSAQPVPGLGAGAAALEIPDRPGGRIPQRFSLRGDECRPGLCGSSQLQAVPAVPFGGFPGLQGLPGDSAIRRAAVRKRFQPDQPLQSGSGASQRGGPGFRLLLRPPGTPLYDRLRRSFLISDY